MRFEGEIRNFGGFVCSIKGHYSQTDYAHTEFDNGAAGTVFKTKGIDLRLEARHAKLGNFEGLISVQFDNARFSADGDEAFSPHGKTKQSALFAYEEYKTGWGKLTFGGRVESVKVESLGNPNPDLVFRRQQVLRLIRSTSFVISRYGRVLRVTRQAAIFA